MLLLVPSDHAMMPHVLICNPHKQSKGPGSAHRSQGVALLSIGRGSSAAAGPSLTLLGGFRPR